MNDFWQRFFFESLYSNNDSKYKLVNISLEFIQNIAGVN
jgi:hypothetical protein